MLFVHHFFPRKPVMKFAPLAAVLVCAAAAVAQAADYTHQPSGLKFSLPNGWICSEEGDRLTITNEDKTVAVVGGVIEQEASQAIFGDIKKFLASIDGWNNVVITAGPTTEEADGLELTWYEGNVTIKNENGAAEELEWDMTIVKGGKQILFLVCTGKLDENEEEYEELFESIELAE
jgi:hypothetical protein